MAIPLQSSYPSSALLSELQKIGYERWFAFSARERGALFQLLGHAVIEHLQNRYEVTDFLKGQYGGESSFIGLARYYNYDLSNPAYWQQLGESVKNALLKSINKPNYQSQIDNYQEPDKACWMEITGKLRIALTLYEDTSGGLMTSNFLHEGERNPLIFVSMAKEAESYYLLFHRDFKAGGVKEGFPFYVKVGTANAGIPQLGDSIGRGSSGGSVNIEPFKHCIAAQKDLIECLATMLAATLQQVQPTPDVLALQPNVKTLVQVINPLFGVCSPELSLNSLSIQYLLSLSPAASQVSTQPAVPAVEHTVMNCELFISPNDGSAVKHGHEVFCMQHLSEYLKHYNTNLCPRCGHPLPDTVLRLANPDLHHQLSAQKQYYTTTNMQKPGMGSAHHSTLPHAQATMQPFVSPCQYQSNGHMGAIYTMDCGFKICGGCLSSSQMAAGLANFCPLCKRPMSGNETAYVGQAQASTFR